MKPSITVDFCLCQPNSSSKVETALSVKAMELVRAANSTKVKTVSYTHLYLKKDIKYHRVIIGVFV